MLHAAGEPIDLRVYGPGDREWLVRQHAELYARDEGFDASFGTLVDRILRDFDASHDPARERGWIAWEGRQRLGSIFCVDAGSDGGAALAKLRLFLLLPEARGRGLGQRLLDTCLGFARDAGYHRMTLWTHESHRAACALYAKNGFSLVSSTPVTSFGVPLVEQHWERAI
ncbi:GNAT family N-acetyltransferase [Salipiger pacificus]|uniref:GNAT family N-acetyltransferase n=2 Tax=Salipiger mangrovisoli TaxID=2865933 RepID=A0ABR9WZ26_9RHOB|nr:GNAT family N-acetyltransferase [Salipiger mangrovisoli]MBE9636555.1 GNAT family N-acetyltransferase [Salipiger mangrovisoli]